MRWPWARPDDRPPFISSAGGFMERCSIGLIGWGVVGGGVIDILQRDAALFHERCGLDLHLKTIVDLDLRRKRPQSPGQATVTDRVDALLSDREISVIIHLVPGTTAAKTVCLACLNAGKHVVTANKALLAEHGDELFAVAAKKGVGIAFEAAVAGGIPVIAALRDGLVANRIEAIYGILNGTCNYILTKMEEEGKSFAEALAEAQKLGYAEADPTLDIDGVDTAHKLAILARIAFHGKIAFSSIRCEGIKNITFQDIQSAKRMGARIKLLAVAKKRDEGLELRVAPTLIPLDHPLSSVSKNYNGIYIVGSATGPTLYVGQGAGALPTASAILADVVDVCTGRYLETAKRFRFFSSAEELSVLPEKDELTGSYARFLVPDKAGVLAGIASVLSSHGVSILSIHQGAHDAKNRATIEVITHTLVGAQFIDAIENIDKSGLTIEPTVILRKL
jgi:homoserine dehydrogenase